MSVKITDAAMAAALSAYGAEASYPVAPANHQAALHAALEAALSAHTAESAPPQEAVWEARSRANASEYAAGEDRIISAIEKGEAEPVGMRFGNPDFVEPLYAHPPAPRDDLVAALAPFVADSRVAGNDGIKLIHKHADGLAPIRITVTKSQWLAARKAYDAALEDRTDA